MNRLDNIKLNNFRIQKTASEITQKICAELTTKHISQEELLETIFFTAEKMIITAVYTSDKIYGLKIEESINDVMESIKLKIKEDLKNNTGHTTFTQGKAQYDTGSLN